MSAVRHSGLGGPSRSVATDAALLVVDLQEKLLRVMEQPGRLAVANTVRLVRAAQLLEVPLHATEQYPQGLGPTASEITALISEADREAKMTFHAATESVQAWLVDLGVRDVTLVGIETHICVAQTALELLDLGYRVQVPNDAVAARHERDHQTALERLTHAGATVTSTEAVLFEWIGTAEHPHFKAISALVRDFQTPD